MMKRRVAWNTMCFTQAGEKIEGQLSYMFIYPLFTCWCRSTVDDCIIMIGMRKWRTPPIASVDISACSLTNLFPPEWLNATVHVMCSVYQIYVWKSWCRLSKFAEWHCNFCCTQTVSITRVLWIPCNHAVPVVTGTARLQGNQGIHNLLVLETVSWQQKLRRHAAKLDNLRQPFIT